VSHLPVWTTYLQDWLPLVGTVATTAAALWKGRHLLRAVRTAWHTVTGVKSLAVELAAVRAELGQTVALTQETLATLREVRSQLRPNGGSSLHDLVHAIAAAQRARDDRDAQALFWTDADGRLTHANRAYQRLTGRTAEELRGSGWVNCVAVEERERVLDLWRDAVTEGRDLDDRYLLRDAAGELRGCAVHATRLLATDGRLLGYYGELLPLR